MVTVTGPIVLDSSSGSLVLSLDEEGVGGWCRVQLLVEGTGRPLGAERLKHIAEQLKSFLADASPGRRWIFGLSELHTSAYGEHCPHETIIDLQDGNAKWFARLELTPDEKHAWMLKLSKHVM